MIDDVVFPKPEDLGPRPWGVETLLALAPGKFSFKKLEMKAGTKGGLQFHQLKDEIAILLSGRMIVRFDSGSGHLVKELSNLENAFTFRQA